MMTQITELLAQKIKDRTIRVGVIGMGYVGLPLALAFVERGKIKVTGFDIDPKKTDALKRGESYIMYIGPERVRRARDLGLFDATSDLTRLGEPDALLIAVPTPLTPQRTPDMRYVIDTARQVRDTLRRGQLVVLESTTYPGTTDELVRSILEESGLKCGEDFLMAFSPEREDPGNRRFSTTSIPKIVGGVNAEAGDVASALYTCAVEKVVRVSSARVAEATKLTENIFRAVNIALVNELKVIYDRMGIDVWDVLDAAATKPFGFMKFTPGPGLGGHCIPLDPFYLTWKAREYGLTTRFIELAGEVNVAMPQYVINKLQAALNQQGKPLRGSRVLILGLAYKKDIDDPRESPSFELIELLLEQGAEVSYHDPHILEAPRMRAHPHLRPMASQPLTGELLGSIDAVLIATDHTAVNYALVAEHARLIVDTRGVYRESRPNVVKA
jgi:UDP-N-acetyl-D-glucosamine dehydrogenase